MSEPRRPRNAEATRDAILRSARELFARSGYDGAGVREIAAGAGVSAMLVNRYFGSKELLFAEVVADTMTRPTILTAANLGSNNLGQVIAEMLVNITKEGETPLEGFQIMLRSASSERAAEIAREQIEGDYLERLAGALKGKHKRERAALAFAIVAGVQVMRQMIALKPLSEANPKLLSQLLAPLFESLVGNAP